MNKMRLKTKIWLSQYIGVVIAGLIIIGVGFQLLPIAVARAGAVLAVLLQIIVERRADGTQFLTSPLFLLGSITLIFFSFIPGVADPIFPAGPLKKLGAFFGSNAERGFVIFGLGCLAVHALIIDKGKMPQLHSEGDFPQGSKIIYIFAVIALGVSIVSVINFMFLEWEGQHLWKLNWYSWSTTIRSIAPPLLAFCLCFLICRTSQASRGLKLLAAAVFILSIGSLVFALEGKKPLFMIFAGTLYLLRLKSISSKTLINFALVSVLGGIILIQIVQIIRVPHASVINDGYYDYTIEIPSPLSRFLSVLRAKFVLRQVVTGYCFHNVIDQHWEQPFSANSQLFWLKGLVPRALWPQKPSLSLGAQYAAKYCGQSFHAPHSASISLLGQPVIYGGGLGLLIHGGILIGCLGGLMWFGRNPRSISSVTAVALLPWLIDFDQDFAQYAANAVKFFLVMLPLVFLAAKMERQSKPTERS